MTTDKTPPEPRRFDAGGALLALDERSASRRYAPSRTRPAAYLGSDADPALRAGYLRDGRVAIVRIEGPLEQRACDGWWSFWDGYDAVCARICAALGDPAVDVVLLVVDSPGGVCAGNIEAAKILRLAIDATGKKVVAYADEMICSAAYALSCVADEIVTPASGMVGSVGTMLLLRSMSGSLEQDGIQVIALTSGDQKTDGHPLLPFTPDAIARLQGEVDTFAAQFLGFVAEQRGLTVPALKALQAGTFIGQAAVDKGLADRLGSFVDALALAHSLIPTPAGAPSAAPVPTGARPMKSILAHLGLTADATEGEALAAVTRLTDTTRDLAAITGKTSAPEAVGVVRGWAAKATAYDTLLTERKDEQDKARATAVEDIFAMALSTGRRTTAQVEAARKSIQSKVLVLDTDEKVAAYRAEIEAGPIVLPGKDEKKPEGGNAIGGKSWGELSFTERAQMRRDNPEAARALKQAHDEQPKTTPAKAPKG